MSVILFLFFGIITTQRVQTSFCASQLIYVRKKVITTNPSQQRRL